ncbi:multidrug ABC transporter permease [Thermoplasmatales archaeon SM1-50]|nr:MAG: multidrug ABC transporter permease [Thermoplasmatales archaeon SM1-50]
MDRKDFQAIYMLWLRQMKRFLRTKSRVVATIVQPLFFLFILGFGLNIAIFPGMEGSYITFLAPGIIAMAILFSSMFTGVSVLWDRQSGFLQEVLVAPVSRLSIVIGRTFGGATVALIQGLIIMVIAIVLGVQISGLRGFLLTIFFMILLSFTAVGFGLILASTMRDFEGFQSIMSLIVMPLMFLSSSFYPINESLPDWLRILSFCNPLFYMVDGIRGSFTGINYVIPPLINLGIILVICIIIMVLGTHFFNKSEI